MSGLSTTTFFAVLVSWRHSLRVNPASFTKCLEIHISTQLVPWDECHTLLSIKILLVLSTFHAFPWCPGQLQKSNQFLALCTLCKPADLFSSSIFSRICNVHFERCTTPSFHIVTFENFYNVSLHMNSQLIVDCLFAVFCITWNMNAT